ncbi:MAG: Gfo/Idh/MocA family oxidoreductase [Acidobacteria bacterium]|nr:Gfo/Idh/MocA family oxidoreductase [Acidobacteriota bacterium]
MERVRIGLVGCGLFGQSHLEGFRGVPGCEVAAAFDLDRTRAEQAASQFGIARACASLEEICALADLHAIDVVTSETAHLEPVLKALEHDKHVFLEKPMAITLEDCSRMIRTAEDAGRFLMVGHILRFETKYRMIKEAVGSGRLGDVVSMHARRNRPKSLLPRYGRTHPALENCIHDIDLMLWYTAKPVRRVRGYGRKATNGLHPDTFWGVLEFEGGAIGVVETIWLLPEPAGVVLDDAFQLIGTRGIANLHLVPGSLAFLTENGFDLPDVGYGPMISGTAYGALREELAYFCECVRNNQPPGAITPVEARRAVRVALALIESAERGKDIEIGDWD